MTRDEYIFLIILIVNLIVSVAYLLSGSFLIVPAHSLAGGEDREILYDNRRTYLIRFAVMLLCPVIAPLFFGVSRLIYLIVFWKDSDLADVIFSKERVKTNVRADEEVERDIIPLEEAILVNEKKNLRMVMMNIMRKDIKDSLSSITLALDSEDSETAHYAAAVLSDELNKFRLNVQKQWIRIGEEEADQTECEEMLLDYMDHILKQHVFSHHEQLKFVGIMDETAESLYRKDSSQFTLERYEAVFQRILEMKDYDKAEKWCLRIEEQYTDELKAYVCKLKLYFARQDRDAFFETMDALKQSDVVINNETLELIRIFNTRRQ